MENQDIEDNTQGNHHLLSETHLADNIFLNSAEIDGALRKLSRFFNDRIGVADREMVILKKSTPTYKICPCEICPSVILLSNIRSGAYYKR